MKIHKPVTAWVLAAALGLTATGCGENDRAGASAGGGVDADGRFAVDAASCPSDATQELGDGEPIKIGTVAPLSGQYAVVGTPVSAGIKAYFEKVNAAGGVDGHQLELVSKDDGYDPTKTLPQVTELLQKDKVFATLGQIGTPNVAAAQPLAEQTCTPQLWVGSGAPEYGDPDDHPWTTSGFMSYSTEAQTWVDYIKQTKPDARVAYLELETESGAAWATAFTAAADEAGLSIVGSEKTSPTATSVENEITNLLAAKPDVVILMSFVTSCANAVGSLAQGGFDGDIITGYGCASATIFPTLGDAADGAKFVSINKEAGELSEFVADMSEYGDGVKPDDDAVSGYRLGDIMVKTLQAAAKLEGGLTRANLMNAAWNLDDSWYGGWGGQARVDGDKDSYALEFGQMLSFDAGTGKLVPTGEPLDREGQTGTFQGS